uniref:Uncharacterized protein MANES_12G009600 n=1 Tax=Rhizophora mucronata TaxID=61149 RepID=A0A2P2J6R9_RHIMU
MLQPGYDINNLFREAQMRWLKPAEVLSILQNHDKYQLTQEPPQQPPGGSVFLFNKRVLRFFRKDGHSWRKKKDGRTVGEAHERLKVGNVETLNCYYAHGEKNPSFQRRSYWMLDPAHEHIVLVHYRELSEGKSSSGSAEQLSSDSSSTPSPSVSSYSTQNHESNHAVFDKCEQYQNICSPGSVEFSSETVNNENGVNGKAEIVSPANNEVSEFLRKLEEHLSLNEDNIKDIEPLCNQQEATHDSELLGYGRQTSMDGQSIYLQGEPEHFIDHQSCGGPAGMQQKTDNFVVFQEAGDFGAYPQSYLPDYTFEGKDSLSWNEVLESSNASSDVNFQKNPVSTVRREPDEEQESTHWLSFSGTDAVNSSILPSLEVENFKVPMYSSVPETHDIIPDYYGVLYDQGQNRLPVETDSMLTVAQQQKFTIHEVSPEWGYATEPTKIIIVGSFLCDPSESAWTCMFGDSEVPLQIIQEGVICCEAPPHIPGKVTLCITSGNRESSSEIREFEYRAKTTSCSRCNSSQVEASKSPEELLLLVRFVQMLLSDCLLQKEESVETGIHFPKYTKTDDDTWGSVIEGLLVGSGTSSGTTDWLLHQLLQDKLCQWLSLKSQRRHNQSGCSLSKKEQGIIHLVGGLGFEWALGPILSHGVSIDFRDINGWTALHWAARSGREKMVAALLASGASPGAVTDPSSQDPTGRTAAYIAAASGHKGLAGYLSEVALTSHLSSLTIEENELSKGSAEIQAERTVNSISNEGFTVSEDQVSLKDTLAAVRNAAQAAARIQAAFRAHSFRKRQEREAATRSVAGMDEYGILGDDVQGISLASKLAFHNPRVYNSAALSIQKKYRGWKGRKDFLALRQKVVKIQAHVRGYQVRKHYRVICWAVGILDKAVLRWRRKGAGLRGFRKEAGSTDESSEDEDILKVFRKQKVDGAIDEAVARVLSMVDSPEARQQYHRMLERYRQAKAELGDRSEATSTSLVGVSDMENDEMFQF